MSETTRTGAWTARALASLLGGVLVALMGWSAVRSITTTTLQELIFAGAPPGRHWTVALVFRAKECPGRMQLIDDLNQVAGAGLQVRGILVVEPGRFAREQDLVAAFRIGFPVRSVRPGHAQSALGPSSTPAVAVYDPEGRLRLISSMSDPEVTRAILARLRTLATHPYLES